MGNYYISERTSKTAPMAYRDADTFYLPVNVKLEDGMYLFDEYRINLKEDMQNLPTEVILYLAGSLDYYKKALDKLGDKLNEFPEKLGYKWKPVYSGSGFSYELVEDENASGTQKNPIVFEPGIFIKEYYWYTDGTNLYVGIKNGTTDSIEDTEYLEKM